MHKSAKPQRVRSGIESQLRTHLKRQNVSWECRPRMRQVRAKVVPNVRRETLQSEVLREVEHGSKVYTDEGRAISDCTPNSCMKL